MSEPRHCRKGNKPVIPAQLRKVIANWAISDIGLVSSVIHPQLLSVTAPRVLGNAPSESQELDLPRAAAMQWRQVLKQSVYKYPNIQE
jgi:hypothetical protein